MLVAGDGEVRGSVRSASGPWDDVLGFEPCLTGRVVAAVRAEVAELEEQVFPQFVAGQFAVLVFDPFDIGIFHQLHIEPDEFHRNPFDRIGTNEPSCPGINILDAALERRRQPSIRPSAVVEARLSIAGLAGAAIASDGAARIEALLNSLSAMFYFGGEDDLARFLIDDGDPGPL